ncbi:response regulator [Rhizobium leguminosarum]|uniref:Response regulator n=1 Tax=Rhizobium leguminosarum bv. viciae TaxID=387 RepID=A0A7G6RNW9_RHILV|nr:response regulator [Rhizobium leguminosarum]QND43951.1 response regulator [Rhizobium leguminosarum bv. viciae]QIO75667.1 response regulator [Rhizobium leguminosarum bv. trifolii]QIO82679.1 response regulator [Rhizobium leguminosarum bv. trifolii]TAV11202.1 response regulator [Rhizobium leguminosarum]TAW47776.1 response regulator [Rhizobium leguminosarum]
MRHPHGRHVVLVVEDEPLLMMMAVDVVEAVGLEALEATNADDAVLILEGRSDIAVVLTDVEMPGTMNGLALAASVRERWPFIGIIVVSGRVTISRDDLPERGVFFPKPYDVDDLAHTLRRLTA